jgi:aminotransferase
LLDLNKIPESLENKYSKLAGALNKIGKIKYSLGLGEPDFPTPKKIVNSAFNSMTKGFTRYSSPLGIYSLRKKISQEVSKNYKLRIDPENVIVTPGSKMALSLTLMSILRNHDEIIYLSPSYISYLPQILLTNYNIKIKKVELNKNDFSINFKKLEKNFSNKTKVIILNFPHNPTGKILKKNEFNKILKIFKKYSNCYVILDEIYDKLIYTSNKYHSLATVKFLKNRTIILNGFSKSFSMTGWRIGYCVANRKIINNMSLIQQHINTNVPVFTQHAALKAFSISKFFLESYNKNLLKNFIYLKNVFSKNNLVRLIDSDGGLFNFIDISKTKMNSEEFCHKLLKKYFVATSPGIYFGTSWSNFVRISIAIKHNKFKEAINLVNRFILTHSKR